MTTETLESRQFDAALNDRDHSGIGRRRRRGGHNRNCGDTRLGRLHNFAM